MKKERPVIGQHMFINCLMPPLSLATILPYPFPVGFDPRERWL